MIWSATSPARPAAIKPNLILGTYVGSWYPAYYNVGVNWGSDKTNLRYSWFTADYPRTGYAEFFDWISTGCYYPVATRADARKEGLGEKATVEYAADLSNQAVANGSFVYPGVYVPDYIEQAGRVFARPGRGGAAGAGMDDLRPVVHRSVQLVAASGTRLQQRRAAPDRHPGLLSAVRSAMDAVK